MTADREPSYQEMKRRLRDAEAALREREKWLKLSLDGADLGAWDWHVPSGRVTYNERWAEMLGYRLDEIESTHRNWESLVHPDDMPAVRKALDAHLDGRTDAYEARFRMHHKSGAWIWILDKGRVIERDEAGRPLRACGTHLDITELQEAQERVRRSESLFRSFFETNVNYCYMISPDGIILDVNSAALKALGYERDELIGQSLNILYAPESQARRMKVFEEWKRTGHIQNEELVIQTKSGERRTVLLSAGHVLDPSGEICHSVSVQTDITRRKLAEKRLQQTLNATTSGIWYWHFPTNQLIFGPRYYTMLGYEPDEFPPTYENWIGLIHPEDQESALAVARKYLETKPDLYENEFRLRTKSGEYRWIQTRAKVVERSDSGEALLMIGNHQDITERKYAEESLRRSQSMLARTERIAHIGSWEWEIESDKVTWSEEMFRIFRMELSEIGPTWAEHPALYHPDDFARLAEAAEKAASEGKPYELELRALCQDGEVRICLARGFAEMGPDGRAVRLFGSLHDITEQKRAEDALRASEQKFRSIAEQSSDVIALTDEEGVITYVSPSAKQVFGADSRDMVGCHFTEFLDESAVPLAMEAFRRSLEQGDRSKNLELLMKRKDGALVYCELNGSFYSSEAASGTLVLIRDITRRKEAEKEKARLEEQFQQSQKLESIGRLAGGVAHDFNNMLGIIIANAELTAMQIDPGEAIYQPVKEILKASERAAETVRQLLAFARKQPISPRFLDLNDAVSGSLKMLRRLIGEDIDLVWRPGKVMGKVRMDPSQVHQMLANLLVNSRDAMPTGGAITIQIENRLVDESYAGKHNGFAVGDYVLLTVSDTGVGMSQEIMEHIFDPFFTTKDVGKGTGLGLATVYGIVKQNKGFIYPYSEPGQGTTFKIYLPRFEGKEEAAPRKAVDRMAPVGAETVLVAEDEAPLLDTCRYVLQKQGYTVLAARTSDEALEMAQQHPGNIHLLLTDVVMPRMNGRELWERVQLLRPKIKALFMSGYASDVLTGRGILAQEADFIEKPFSFKGLAGKVREVLDKG